MKKYAALCVALALTACSSDEKPNQIPTIQAMAEVQVRERGAVAINALASDDGVISAYNWQQISGPDVDAQSGSNASLSFTAPTVDSDETARFLLTVTDDKGATTSSTVDILIINNSLPEIAALADASVKERRTLSLTAQATDNDGEVASYSWAQTSGTPVTLSSQESASLSFVAPSIDADETLSFTLSVSDNDGEVSTQDLSVKLINNQLPVISGFAATDSSALSISENTNKDYTLSVSDPDGSVSEVKWQLLSGSAELITDEQNKQTLRLNAQQINSNQEIKLKATVLDDDADSTVGEYTLTHVNTHHNLAFSGLVQMAGTSLTSAPVTFTSGDIEAEVTTNNSGEYTISADIPVENEFYTYQLNAYSSDQVVLSTMGNVSSLVQTKLSTPALENNRKTSANNGDKESDSAGKLASRQQDNNSDEGLNLNSFSSSEAVALAYLILFYEIQDGDMKTMSDYLDLYKNIDPKQLMDVSALIEFADERGETLDLSKGKAYVDNYLREAYEDPDALTRLNEILEVKRAAFAFDVSDILTPGLTYYMTLASAPGTIRRGLTHFYKLKLNSDGSATKQSRHVSESETWSVVDNKIVLVPNEKVIDRTEEYWDKNLEITYDYCSWNLNRTELSPLSSWSLGAKSISYNSFYDHRCELDGEVVIDTTFNEEIYVSAYSDGDVGQFEDAELAGKQVLMNYESPTSTEYNFFDDYEEDRSLYISFNADGTGTVPDDSNARFTWVLNDDGQAILTFDAGYQITWTKLYNDYPNNYGASAIVAEYVNEDEVQLFQEMLVYVDKPTLSESDFIGTWDHGFQSSEPSYNILREGVYWEFKENNRGEMIFFNRVEEVITRTVEIHWELKDKQLWLYRGFGSVDENGARIDWVDGYCNPVDDAACYAHQIRRWDFSLKLGNRVYVQETLKQDNDMWDREDSMTTTFENYRGEQRANFYEKVDFVR